MTEDRRLAIMARNLSFTYPRSSRPAVRKLHFNVRRQEIFGLLGPSGAGKSTTQNLLIGLLRGYEGSIEVFGRPLRDWGPEYYARIGVGFELPNHFLKLSARENLAYFRALYGDPKTTATPEEVLQLVGLEDDIDKPVGAFSKGMKNRLTLARSLLNRPELWFLDEPTSGLDPVNAVRVRELIQARRDQGATVVITTHDMHVAEALCDRVGFIVDGELVECDAPASLERRFGRRELYVSHGDEEDPTQVSFPLDGLGDNASFLELIKTAHIVAMHSQETSLEDVFVQVTGRSLT